MNYYNYFTEIEDAFIRRRGKHLFLSPMDWALIESWKERGVPLHIALRAIETVFDNQAAQARRRSIKTLFYCQEEVEAQFAEWLEMQLGATATNGARASDGANALSAEADASVDELPFPRETILEHLEGARATLLRLHNERKQICEDDFCETLKRVGDHLQSLKDDFKTAVRPDFERLEQSLSFLEKMLDAALRAVLPVEELNKLRGETETQLAPYRQRMTRETYEQTFENLLLKKMRANYDLPRLSLFHL